MLTVQDYRNLSYIDYSVYQLVTQRIYGLVLGYEDVNDHDKLRHDTVLTIALKKLDFIESNQGSLAGKSTINRLEYCPNPIVNQKESRYHRLLSSFIYFLWASFISSQTSFF